MFNVSRVDTCEEQTNKNGGVKRDIFATFRWERVKNETNTEQIGEYMSHVTYIQHV
jgi:hypothetical protein